MRALGGPRIILVTGPSPVYVDGFCRDLAALGGAEVRRLEDSAALDALAAASDAGRVSVAAVPLDAHRLDAIASGLAGREISVLRLVGDDDPVPGMGGAVSLDLGPAERVERAVELLTRGRAHEFHRRAGRIVPVDGGRALLLEGFVPGKADEPFWCAIGGGIEPGETPAEAAVRELAEEAGLAVAVEETRALRTELVEFDHSGLRFIQEQTYVVARVDSSLPLSMDGMEPAERPTMLRLAWVDAADVGTVLPAPEHLGPVCRDAVDLLRSVGS